MKKSDIIDEIKNKVGSSGYSVWTIGVTDEPDTRKSKHETDGENVNQWKHWKTESETEGRTIEEFFIDKGMKGGKGGGGKAGYVYIF